ncbi:putative lipid II flippase FtsW [Tamaricihabitans halophyticus]|uniref:putative lipid II flippase FtsW n=1 Tax=Tamaricihabitans halophyticus TaxID=1262583 RepID=UPI003C7738F9
MTSRADGRDQSGEDESGGRKARRSKAKRDRSKRSWLIAIRTALTAWLGRPLASFHLIMAICGLLAGLGLIMVLSASSVSSYDGDGSSVYALFGKQAMFVGIGAVLFWFGVRIPLPRIRRLSGPGMLVVVVLLIAVLTPLGTFVYGARRQLDLGPLSVQPVELAKLGLALWGAHVLISKQAMLHRWRHLLVPVVPVALLLFGLVMMQPDLGSTVSLGVVLIALLWFVGAAGRLFATIFLAALGGIVVLALGEQYRLARIVSFLNPDTADPAARYQADQAQFALADGGLFGQGLGQGGSKWNYLPNVHHDFIFALIGEELGFVGSMVVLGLYAALAIVGLRIALRNVDPWIRVVAGTLTVWLVSQAAINIGYVVGLLPVTGIPLPLISYGGTSVAVTMLVFGILANCARHEPESVAALRSQGPGRFGKLLRLPAPEPYRPPPERRKAPRRSPAPAGNRTPPARSKTGGGHGRRPRR